MAPESDDPRPELVYWQESGGTGRPRVAVYFAAIDGQVECLRIEIGAQFAAGEYPRRLGARFASSSRPKVLDAATLRGVKLPPEVKRARKAWLASLEEIAGGIFAGQKVSASVRRQARERLDIARESVRYDRPGPSPLGRDHFEKVARVYKQAAEAGEHPTLAVKEQFQVAYPTAGRWVSIARNEYRLLPKTTKGKARAGR